MKKKFYIALLCLAVAAVIAGIVEWRAKEPLPSVVATWVWDNGTAAAEPKPILDFAQAHHVNLIYLKVNYDQDPQIYRDFNRSAFERGIRVHLLDGDPSWVEPQSAAAITHMTGWLLEYNRACLPSEHFAGLHVDIEPYNAPNWNSGDQRAIINKWENTVDFLIKEARKAENVEVGADLPFWLNEFGSDGSHGNSPDKKTLSDWMIERFDSVTLMAYRDKALGSGSIVDIVKEEAAAADLIGKKIIVGVETNPRSERHTTMYEAGQSGMSRELKALNREMRKHRSYAGYAVHDYAAWTKLKP